MAHDPGCLAASLGVGTALNLHGFAMKTGDLLMFGAVFTFSCNLIFTRILSRRLTPFIITVYSFALSAVLFDPFVLSSLKIDWAQPLRIWGLAFAAVLVAQGLANVLWNKGMQDVGAAKSAIVLNLQPMMTMLLDFILFGHPVTVQQTLGAALVFGGVLLGTLPMGSVVKKSKAH
ncbi:DMT family transporter [Paenibacillus sp. P25]|nr:DMT family transporter [Paenibacillus sp. P25]